MSRILLASNVFPPAIGGPATFVDRVAHELAARGLHVTVVCTSPTTSDPADRDRPFRVVRVSLANRYRYEVEIRLALAREMARHRLVFVNTLDDYVGQVNRWLRRRLVIKVVGDAVWERARNLGRTALDIDAFQRDAAARREFAREIEARNARLAAAARVLVPSDYLRGLVGGWGVPPERITVIPNGVERDFLEVEPAAARNGGPLEALFVGRLTNWKGVDTLLLALRELDGVRLSVLGEGPQYPALVALAGQLGLRERVRFLGRADRLAVRDAMRRSHALVLPSLYEGHAHALLEAGALGLPCIASRCGGNPEVIRDGENGLLVPPQDVAALRSALARLATDEALRSRLGEAARERGRGFALSRSSERLVEVLEGHA